MRIYYSPDKLTKIALHPGIKNLNDMPESSDYSLRIKIMKTPDPMAEMAERSSSGKMRLEPIK